MKLVISTLASLALVAPAFACPNMDHDEAPKTAEKDKAKDTKGQDGAKAKDAPKADQNKDKDQKPADTAKAKDAPKQDAPKKTGDKVSIK